MGHAGDLEGKVVSEEEVATDLGFKDILEFRRWQTDQGYKIAELEHELRITKDDARNFRYAGMRMQKVLEKIEPVLIKLEGENIQTDPPLSKLLLAIGVVCGRGVDWDHVLKDWNLDKI